MKKRMGRPPLPDGMRKIGICIKLDQKIIAWLKLKGIPRSRYINEILDEVMRGEAYSPTR